MAQSKLFLFSTRKDNVSRRLQRSINDYVTWEKVEISRTAGELSHCLCHTNTCTALLLLLVINKKELDDLLMICDLILTIPSILILPDDGRETIAKGHKLLPRFISFMDNDFNEVGTVLEKMLKVHKRSNSVDPFSKEGFLEKS